MSNSKRMCRYCKEYKCVEFMITVNLGYFCDFDHAAKHGMKKAREKSNSASGKAVKELNKSTLRWQHKATQPVFNKLRRLQELNWFYEKGLEPKCISCQKPIGGDVWCNGHLKTVGSNSRLRYDPKNSYLQHNRSCNMAKSGDIEGYKRGLKIRFGDVEGSKIIEYCESESSPIKWAWQDLEIMRAAFNEEIRQLEKLHQQRVGRQ